MFSKILKRKSDANLIAAANKAASANDGQQGALTSTNFYGNASASASASSTGNGTARSGGGIMKRTSSVDQMTNSGTAGARAKASAPGKNRERESREKAPGEGFHSET